MTLHVEPGILYLAALLVSAAVCGFMGYLAIANSDRRGARTFGTLVGILLLWALTEIVELVTAEPSVAAVARRLRFVFVPFIPVTVLVIALQYTDREEYVSSDTVGLLCVIPAVTVGLVATNPEHGFVWIEGMMVSVPPFSVYEVTYRPWFWIYFAYTQVLIVLAVVLFVRWGVDAEGPYRRQAQYILIGISAPWLGNLIEISGLSDSPIDLGPIVFTITGLCIGVAVFRFQFLDLAPIARDTVVEAMQGAVIVLDEEDRVVDANPAARRLLTTANDDVVGHSVDDVAPAALAAACREADGAETLSLAIDGGERVFDVERSALPGRGRVVLLTDVTEQHRQAEQLERQNERLERFASVLSHDLRNPLNVAQGYADLIEQDDADDEYVDRVESALDRMDTMIDDTLALAREASAVTDPESVDLAAIAEEAWKTVPTGDATLTVTVDCTVPADRGRLVRLFENLFRNSVEHSSTSSRTGSGDSVEHNDSGDLTVRVEGISDGFAVADDGTGIPESEREAVLERGYTTNEGGTGLGLAIVAEIARAHGWTVEVGESEAGGAHIAFHGVEGAPGRETP
ncbi:histidine kinase N-terminal 7TM domain-containing protein [Halolamina salifodinae]|uniref:histidine kinase n=1 Tax=Halolamina salifodinae TaxID=1202767 RepID=A0A8T4H108_9EURY|nr:histidine kinase N-terminal 7TM domain-containing protein [Halolamina salifodinae]MBP1987265.1 signal transduction histidine kinase [Halolamina salifodinae]